DDQRQHHGVFNSRWAVFRNQETLHFLGETLHEVPPISLGRKQLNHRGTQLNKESYDLPGSLSRFDNGLPGSWKVNGFGLSSSNLGMKCCSPIWCTLSIPSAARLPAAVTRSGPQLCVPNLLACLCRGREAAGLKLWPLPVSR